MKTQKLSWLFSLMAGLLFIALMSGCTSNPNQGAVSGSDQDAVSKSDQGNVTDIDGNVYKTARIGDQEWMAENLKTTRYNDGSAIPNVTGGRQWERLSTGAYCWYDNDPDNGEIYGALYNWYAVDTGKLCPEGWRVPTDNDWTKLTDYLGGRGIAGGKLKTTGTVQAGNGLWYDPNRGATNEAGFSALPGGLRDTNGGYFGIGYFGFWWSSSEHSSTSAWYRSMSSYGGTVDRLANDKRIGFSVRCVRDIDN